jgi:hypothetical protein
MSALWSAKRTDRDLSGAAREEKGQAAFGKPVPLGAGALPAPWLPMPQGPYAHRRPDVSLTRPAPPRQPMPRIRQPVQGGQLGHSVSPTARPPERGLRHAQLRAPGQPADAESFAARCSGLAGRASPPARGRTCALFARQVCPAARARLVPPGFPLHRVRRSGAVPQNQSRSPIRQRLARSDGR